MATITWRRGDVFTEHFEIYDDAGPADLTGATAQVEVRTPDACIILPLTAAGDGFDWRLSDATIPAALTAPRAWRASLVIEWPDGTKHRDDFTLTIERGC